MAFVDDARSWARRQGAPITIGVIAALVAAFLLSWFTSGQPFGLLALIPERLLPWTLLTYPLAHTGDGTGLIWFLFLLLWLYWVGASVEQELGPRKYALAWLAMILIPAVVLGLGSLAFGRPVTLYGAHLPLSGLTVAWGVRNSGSIIRLYGIIPLSGRILAILTVVLVFFGYGTMSPLIGVLAVAHLALAWLFGMNRLPGFSYSRPVEVYKPSKAQLEKEARFRDEVRQREKERLERERLRRLFEKSGLDDKE
ncbi:MAG TPA: rhomboid family intramembrane serine protease [Fimbriimonas sp.]